jgi:hypothetical protein
LLTPKLRKGDKVVMHTCMEAPYHHGRIWTCQTDEFEANGREYGLVFLEGFSGSFATEYLQYVDVSAFLGMYIDSLGRMGDEKDIKNRRKSD